LGAGCKLRKYQGQNREGKAGGWGRIDGAERSWKRRETGANHLETKGKRKPVTLENDQW
jgi:hypothetical protein